MLGYVIGRIIQFIPLLLIFSIIAYILIELPPGDFLSSHIAILERQGTSVGEEEIARLRMQYGLDKPIHLRYLKWAWNIIRYGDFGRSLEWEKSVSELIGERIGLTVVIGISTLIFTWAVAVPIGVYSSVHQYSLFDYTFTFLGFIGLAIPNFLLALVLIWLSFAHLSLPVTGLFSPEYVSAGWTLAKVGDMFKHIWVPVIVVGTAGTAGIIRIMRGCLLDELRKQYVITARAKGVSERRLLFKYPVRIAINPLISTIGWLLPSIISGQAIVSIVLNLPTVGPLLLSALLNQDMYLAGGLVLTLSALTMIGNLISDILLVWLDPRIRYGRISE